ncbi:hypothetical protein, conserved, partial [Perkinsus marinus ATCC 50983]
VHQDDAEGDKKRIPCPIDPNHTVYERNLEKHIAVCSKTKDNDFIKRQPLYDEGYNIPEGKRPDPTLDGVSITNGDNEDEDAVRKLSDELRKDSTTERIDIEGEAISCEDDPSNVTTRVSESIVSNAVADKHDIQNGRLLRIMEKEGMLSSCDDDTALH